MRRVCLWWLCVAVTSRLVAAGGGPPLVDTTLLYDQQLYQDVLDPELCDTHLRLMSSFEFYDASFRIPNGILQGNVIHYGNYFQCLNIRQELEDHPPVQGKHCMISIPMNGDAVSLPVFPGLPDFNVSWPRGVSQRISQARDAFSVLGGGSQRQEDLPLLDLTNLRLGVCIPRSCSTQQALGRYFNTSLFTLNYRDMHCRVPGDKLFTTADYLAIVIFSLIGLLVLSSTSYELYHIIYKKTEPSPLLSCWSAYGNTRKLFTFRAGAVSLTCIDGVRSFSIIWVVIGHTMLTMVFANVANLLEMIDWFTGIESLWLTAANISVDTFFMLSGLLIVYTSIPKMTQRALVKNIHMYYLNRLLRMFPVLAAAVLIQASLFHHVDDGPNWQHESTNVQSCRNNWWAALLHIQNYYNPQEECLPATWYLAVDIQLHIVSPLVLFWVLGSKRSGWVGVSGAVVASLVAVFTFVLVRQLPGSLYGSDLMDYFKWYYANTLTRSPVFFIGMFYGYVLHVFKKRDVKLSMWFVCTCWVLSLVSMACVIYMFHPLNDLTFNDQAYSNFVNCVKRPLWAVALGWLIFACVHGYGGPINWLLSLTIWKFVARISYAMYIFHYPIQFLKAAGVLAPIYFSIKNVVLNFIMDLGLVIVVSSVVNVVIDMPFATLQGMLLGKGQPRKPRSALAPAPANTQEHLEEAKAKL